MDGTEDLKDHVEVLRINLRDHENAEAFAITVPDAVGFLLPKTTAARFREEPGTLTISTTTAATRKIQL